MRVNFDIFQFLLIIKKPLSQSDAVQNHRIENFPPYLARDSLSIHAGRSFPSAPADSDKNPLSNQSEWPGGCEAKFKCGARISKICCGRCLPVEIWARPGAPLRMFVSCLPARKCDTINWLPHEKFRARPRRPPPPFNFALLRPFRSGARDKAFNKLSYLQRRSIIHGQKIVRCRQKGRKSKVFTLWTKEIVPCAAS